MQSFRTRQDVEAHIKALAVGDSRLPSMPKSVDKFCQSMAGLSKRLEPYFSAIDSYSSVKPEILGLIWGTVQFLFKVSCICIRAVYRNCTRRLNSQEIVVQELRKLHGEARRYDQPGD